MDRCAGQLRPKIRGRVRLTGPNPADLVAVEDNMLAHDEDFKAPLACAELCRDIGNSASLQGFNKREVMPGDLSGQERVLIPGSPPPGWRFAQADVP